jgi:hypothetical protein
VNGYLAEIIEKGGGGSEAHAPRATHENDSGYRTSLQRNTAIVKLHTPPAITASSVEMLNQR